MNQLVYQPPGTGPRSPGLRRRVMRFAALACLCAAGSGSRAQTSLAPPAGVLNISASATIEAPKDWMSLTLAVTRDGADAGMVQSQLKQALDHALEIGRRQARAEQIELRTGTFSVGPRYDQKGKLSGWQGTAELTIEGRDMAGIGQLSGKITGLSIARVGYSLSRDSREKLEGEATSQAIARFRARAADHARQFGFGGFSVREVTVNAEADGRGMPLQQVRGMAFAEAADAALPVEAGKGSVTATVAGSIQLLP